MYLINVDFMVIASHRHLVYRNRRNRVNFTQQVDLLKLLKFLSTVAVLYLIDVHNFVFTNTQEHTIGTMDDIKGKCLLLEEGDRRFIREMIPYSFNFDFTHFCFNICRKLFN